MREVTIREAIKELGLPCEVRKAPSNIPYVLEQYMTASKGIYKAVSARRKKADGTFGFYTALSINQKVYIDYGKDNGNETSEAE